MKMIMTKVVPGHKIASGTSSTDLRFPQGTIKTQQPFFKELGLDFDKYFENGFVSGTLNLSVAPHEVIIKQPEYYFKNVKWTDLFPAENFYFSEAQIFSNGLKMHKALIYIPDPLTKPDHFQGSSIIEVIAEYVPAQYGQLVLLNYNTDALSIEKRP
jgi:hypothetical protein